MCQLWESDMWSVDGMVPIKASELFCGVLLNDGLISRRADAALQGLEDYMATKGTVVIGEITVRES